MTEAPASAASDTAVLILASKYDTDVTGTKTFPSDGDTTECSYASDGSSDIVSNSSTVASRTSVGTTDEEEYYAFNAMIDNLCSCVDDIGDGTNICRTEHDTREKPSLLYRSNHGRYSTKLQKRNNNVSFIQKFAAIHQIKMPNDSVDSKSKRGREIASKGGPLQRIRGMVSNISKKSGPMSGTNEKKQGRSDRDSNKRGKKKHRRKKKKESSIVKKEDGSVPSPLNVVLESPKFDKSAKTPVQGHAHRSLRDDAAVSSPSVNDNASKASCSTRSSVSPSVEAGSTPPVSSREPTASLLRAARSSSKPLPKFSSSLKTSMLVTGSAQTSARKEPRSPTSMFPKKSPRAPSKSIVATSISASSSAPSPEETAHRPTIPSSTSPSRAVRKSFWVKTPQMRSGRLVRSLRSQSPVKSPRYTSPISNGSTQSPLRSKQPLQPQPPTKIGKMDPIF